MPLTDQLQAQVQTRNVLRNLTENPLQELRRNIVIVGSILGQNTTSQRLLFACVNEGNDLIRIVTARDMRRTAINPRDAIMKVLSLATPVRLERDNYRLNALQLHPVGNNLLWVTPTQTGCSVMILDWGNNRYSMVHLRPHANNQFNSLSQYVFYYVEQVKWRSKVYYLRQDLTTIVNATTALTNRNPQRYILVESNYSETQGRNLQIIGVKVGIRWQFFLQSYGRFRRDNLTVRELGWNEWNSSFIPSQE